MIVKCLTVWEPWASLLVTGIKKYETRGWTMGHRGLLLIHAAKVQAEQGLSVWHAQQLYKRPEFLGLKFTDLPFGHIVGAVMVRDVQPTTDLLEAGRINSLEFSLGDFGPDRYGFYCDAPNRFARPIAAVGRQGLFNVDTSWIDGLDDQLREVPGVHAIPQEHRFGVIG